MDLNDSKTLDNLKDAFAGESQANRRYLYFANNADIEGKNEEGETGHAHGHLEYLEAVGDPATGLPIASVAGETHEYTDMYPGMAKTARDEGSDEIADWFETLANWERSHARKRWTLCTPARPCYWQELIETYGMIDFYALLDSSLIVQSRAPTWPCSTEESSFVVSYPKIPTPAPWT